MSQLLWKTFWWFLKKLNVEQTHNPEIPLPSIYTKEVKTYSDKNVYTNIYRSTMHNSQKVGTTQMSIKIKKNKHIVVYPHRGIFINHEKEPKKPR